MSIFNMPPIPEEAFPDSETYKKAVESTIPDPYVDAAELNEHEVDITGINLPTLLMMMFNEAHPVGLGYLHSTDTTQMTLEEADQIVGELINVDPDGSYRLYIDYLMGVPIKLKISHKPGQPDLVDPYNYDVRQREVGKLRKIVARIKEGAK